MKARPLHAPETYRRPGSGRLFFALVHNHWKVFYIQNVFIHLFFELLAVITLHFIKNFHRIGPDGHSNKRVCERVGCELNFSVIVTQSDRRVVAKGGEHASRKGLHGESTGSRIDKEFSRHKPSLRSRMHSLRTPGHRLRVVLCKTKDCGVTPPPTWTEDGGSARYPVWQRRQNCPTPPVRGTGARPDWTAPTLRREPPAPLLLACRAFLYLCPLPLPCDS